MRKKVCPNCERGKDSYELDRRSPECPYLSCHDGKRCSMFVKMQKQTKRIPAFLKLRKKK